MRRREFVGLVGGAAAWPFAAWAQQSKLPVIGFLHNATLEAISPERITAFRAGLAETGYVEGDNVVIEYRWAAGQNDRLPDLAADLVRRRVDVIATPNTTASALAAKRATESIPVVFMIGGDPVAYGIVSNLSRPSGNLTGVSLLTSETTIAKRLELLRELATGASSIAMIVNPTNAGVAVAQRREAEKAAQLLGLQLTILSASTEGEIEASFASLAAQGAGALLLGDDATFNAQRHQIAALATRHRIPAIYAYREFTAAGGLISYGPSLPEAFRIVGRYTGRILRGEKPGDLPVQQATKLELVINMKTAKALGLNFPLTLLGRADEVIE